MGTKQNPGAYDCYANALVDEPMFVLLARDQSAPNLVRQWAMCRHMEIQYGVRPVSDSAAAGEAYGCARAMEKWRTANDGRWRTEQPPVPPDVNADLLAILKAAAEDDAVQWHDGPLLKAARAAISRAEGREP